MSKMSDLAMVIEELRNAAATIKDTADWLAEQFSDSKETVSVEKAITENKPELTLEQVRAVLAEKSRNGHTAEIRSLLEKYGATKLSAVDPNNYEALLKDAEVLDDAT